MQKLFSETIRIDDDRSIAVNMMPNGLIKISGQRVDFEKIHEHRILLSRDAIMALNEILTRLIKKHA